MDWLAASADAYPDAPAIITEQRTVSYRELDQAADGVASIVSSSGSFGVRAVAFWGERTIEAAAAVWGIPRAGVAAMAVDPRTSPSVAMDATRAAGVGGLWTTPDGGFDRLMDRGNDGPMARPRPEATYIVSTSGTEGHPRGVVLTDDNLAAAVAGSRQRLGNSRDDSWLCVLPLFHVGGLSILWRQAEAGAPVLLLDRFETESVAAALESVTYASLVPVMLHRLVRTGREWTGLAVALIGGAAADDRLLSVARAAGIPAVPTYGMTETCSQIATPAPGAALDGSVGKALQGGEIRVVAGGESVVGAEGQIEVRGPMVSRAYVGEADRAPDAWLATGDIGKVDDEGRLTVIGRSDRVIISGGENVHPLAVERLLMANSAIHRARVFGRPDSEWGMLIVAEVESDVGVEALEAWAAQKMSPNMRPREWRIVERVKDKLGG